MKKFFFIFMSIFIFFLCPFQKNVRADSSNFYAKVTATGVQLCSSPSETSALFVLPYSYFVKVDYIVDDYYKVIYKDVEGYVRRDRVTLMNGVPQVPFFDANYEIFVPFGLYQSPSQTSSVITTLTNTDDKITYYGELAGQQVTSDNNIWYYSQVTISDEEQFGYVFSGVTDLLTQPVINNETFDIVSDDFLETPSSEFKNLSTGTKIMLIVAISVPSLLILYFLIKPSKIVKNTTSKIISKGISAGKSNQTYRGLVKVSPGAGNARNYSQCDSLLIGDACGSHTVPYIENRNKTAQLEHEATTSKISDEQLFYCLQRGIGAEEAVSLIVNGFCKEVMQHLPLEFAIEAAKLINISLEGSVG